MASVVERRPKHLVLDIQQGFQILRQPLINDWFSSPNSDGASASQRLCMQAQEARDQDGQEEFPSNTFDNCQAPCYIRAEYDIAIAECRQRNEAEVNRPRRIEVRALRWSLRSGIPRCKGRQTESEPNAFAKSRLVGKPDKSSFRTSNGRLPR